ncbi:MAG: hypothetical protein ACUVRG_06080 [Ignavibacterium sp.]|uniref:hypothetical protein n=1 Tax=Ignavibacterium sp. TaxID=2651167 RepID=UPI00404B212F
MTNKPEGDFTIKCISGDKGSFGYAKEIEKLLIAAVIRVMELLKLFSEPLQE